MIDMRTELTKLYSSQLNDAVHDLKAAQEKVDDVAEKFEDAAHELEVAQDNIDEALWKAENYLRNIKAYQLPRLKKFKTRLVVPKKPPPPRHPPPAVVPDLPGGQPTPSIGKPCPVHAPHPPKHAPPPAVSLIRHIINT